MGTGEHPGAESAPPKSRVKVFAYFRDMRAKIVVLGLVAGLSAQFQAAALVIVVMLGKSLAGGHARYVGKLGPFRLHVSNMRLIALGVVAVLAAGVLDTAVSWFKSRMTTGWDFAHREQVIQEYLHADFQTQSAERLGTLALITGYVQRGASLLGAISGGIMSALSLLVYIGFALLIDYRAALLMVGAVAFLAVVLKPVMTRVKRYSQQLSAAMIVYNRDVTEATRMVRDLRVFDALTPLGEDLTATSRDLARLRQRTAFVNSQVSTIYTYLGMLIVLATLAVAQAAGSVDIVTLGAIALLLIRSMSYGQGLQGSYQNVVDGVPYLERLEALRDTYRARRTHDGTRVLEVVRTLELDDVRYSYDGQVDAVAGVSAEFHVGEVIGIVGPSGGGKSTLSQLLLRLREPTGGDIRIDGESARDFKLSSWYRHVSLVPQDPRLFHATVAENIALLDRKMTREHIVEAAKAAGIHDVIESLESGYDTPIGPAFRDLSGGQIQRVGIARALARGAQILVLDEPTSALDVHSEAVIQATLEGLRGHALVLIIAHRLSTLSICDRIMVIRDGEVETLATLSEASEQSDFFRRALEAGTLEITVDAAPAAPDVAPDNTPDNV
ncbi:MAG TPA: ABC transporter ATP-binding protein [Acidimicrobiia bacterium]|nr:ABC transporter ATP-binding protein [Acidimicrobiia bacterium]